MHKDVCTKKCITLETNYMSINRGLVRRMKKIIVNPSDGTLQPVRSARQLSTHQ